MRNTDSTNYELLVKTLVDNRLYDGAPIEDVKVQHNQKLRGKSGHHHQIDVVAEFRLLGVRLLILVECKTYSRRVGIDEICKFAYRISDIGAHKGILVTTGGFQRGAVQVARAEGIALVVARDMEWKVGGSSPEGVFRACSQWVSDALAYTRWANKSRSCEIVAGSSISALLDQITPPDDIHGFYPRSGSIASDLQRLLYRSSLDRRFCVSHPFGDHKATKRSHRKGVGFDFIGEEILLLTDQSGLFALAIVDSLLRLWTEGR